MLFLLNAAYLAEKQQIPILSEFFPFFLVTVLPHTLNKRITVYNIDKEEDDLIEFLVNLVNDYFVNKNHILSYFG